MCAPKSVTIHPTVETNVGLMVELEENQGITNVVKIRPLGSIYENVNPSNMRYFSLDQSSGPTS